MRKVKVKICGITRLEDIRIVSTYGADAIGFVVGVPSSPRSISLKKAEELIKKIPDSIKSVLVMVPKKASELFKAYKKLRPDIIQIHEANMLNAFTLRKKLPNTTLIKAVNANPIDALKDVIEVSKLYDAILLDSFAPGIYGGTGIVNDWNLSKRIKDAIYPKPVILAGGLNPDNVKEAIYAVQPYAVDVCSGVESHLGIKDPEKVLAFIKNAKEIEICDDQC